MGIGCRGLSFVEYELDVPGVYQLFVGEAESLAGLAVQTHFADVIGRRCRAFGFDDQFLVRVIARVEAEGS